MLLARSACFLGSGSPIAALNFLNQFGLHGRGVGLAAAIRYEDIQDARCFSQNLSMKDLHDILM